VADLLALTSSLPVLDVDVGDPVVREGERTGAVFVLERGLLHVTRGGVAIAEISAPGALVGEIAVLVGGDHSATVTAAVPSRLRVAADGAGFLRSSPDVTLHVATEVAQRLQLLIAYLADLQRQYAGAPGLAMVHDVLAKLTDRKGAAFEAGSDREPDPLY
jgi:CRP-like cAMP-binding protein